MHDVVFIYDDGLSKYELSDSHPFKPVRLELTKSLLEHSGLLKPNHLVSPEPISEAELLGVHDKIYVDVVKAVSKDNYTRVHDLPPCSAFSFCSLSSLLSFFFAVCM